MVGTEAVDVDGRIFKGVEAKFSKRWFGGIGHASRKHTHLDIKCTRNTVDSCWKTQVYASHVASITRKGMNAQYT